MLDFVKYFSDFVINIPLRFALGGENAKTRITTLGGDMRVLNANIQLCALFIPIQRHLYKADNIRPFRQSDFREFRAR